MINRERLDSVRKKYGHYASWAVWGAEGLTPKGGMGDISFFEDPREELLATLNPEVILVGLNISRPIQRPFGNFHPDYPEAQDYKLRHALYETGFWGGYLTERDYLGDADKTARRRRVSASVRGPSRCSGVITSVSCSSNRSLTNTPGSPGFSSRAIAMADRP